jgi:hypothetical protein
MKKYDELWGLFLATRFPTRVVQVETRSGRRCRYNITDFRVFPGTESYEIGHLASQIVNEKYRNSSWDRLHPKIDAQQEIYEALVALLEWLVQEMFQFDESCKVSGKRGLDQRFVSLDTKITFTFKHKKARKGPETRRVKVWAIYDDSHQLIEYFDFPHHQAAERRAEKLTLEKGRMHFVNETKLPVSDLEES